MWVVLGTFRKNDGGGFYYFHINQVVKIYLAIFYTLRMANVLQNIELFRAKGMSKITLREKN